MKLSSKKKKETDVTETIENVAIADETTSETSEMSDNNADDSDIEILDMSVPKKDPVKARKKKKIIRRCIIGGIAVVIIVCIVVLNLSAKNAIPMLSVVEIATGDVEETVTGSGFVNSEVSKTYFSPVNATIGEFSIKMGDSVKSGDKLMTFDTSELLVETEKATLTAVAADEGYQQSLAESSEAARDYAVAKANVDTYRLLIVAQRNYINDLNEAITGKTNSLADTAQCARDGIQKKINEKNDELTDISKRLLDFGTDSEGIPDEEDADKYNKLKKESQDISNEISDLSASLSSVYYPVDTIAESRQLADAQNLLSDMQSYLAKDEGKMESAKNAMLDAHAKEQLKANNEVSQLTAKQAQQELSDASTGIFADFNGIISELPAISGGPATKGSPLITLQSTDDVMVAVSISKYNLEKIKLGQKATITVAGNTYDGTVSRINGIATANASGTPVITAEVHIDNPDSNIYLGVEGKVVIHTNEAKGVLLAPVETINSDTKGDFCYVIENNVLVRKNVVTGVSSDTFIEVVEGIKPGDKLVNDYSTTLTEGMAAMEMPPLPTNGVSDDNAETAAEE